MTGSTLVLRRKVFNPGESLVVGTTQGQRPKEGEQDSGRGRCPRYAHNHPPQLNDAEQRAASKSPSPSPMRAVRRTPCGRRMVEVSRHHDLVARTCGDPLELELNLGFLQAIKRRPCCRTASSFMRRSSSSRALTFGDSLLTVRSERRFASMNPSSERAALSWASS